MSNAPFTLREWRLSDAASLAEQANNIRIWNNLRDGLPHPYSEKDGETFIKMALSQPKPAPLLAIVVDEKAVGSMGIVLRTDVERISAELGYFIGEAYWNRGIMTQAVKRMVTYAFTRFPQLVKIYATPFDFNIASHKVLQKAGFEREAILKRAAVKNGKIVDEHYYSIFKSQWQGSVIIRPLGSNETPVLRKLQYEAIFVPQGMDPPPFKITEQPEIDIYIRDFGLKSDDYCLVAELDGKIIGGVWVRILSGDVKGFGNIDDQTPEFAISLFKEYKNQGFGTKLMHSMLNYLKNKGYKQCSLAVQKENYAVKMYQNAGFLTMKELEKEYIMICDLQSKKD